MIRWFDFRFAARSAPCSPGWPCSLAPSAAAAQAPLSLQISWEVRNRFRLFREERDFRLHVESGRDRSILAAEQALETAERWPRLGAQRGQPRCASTCRAASTSPAPATTSRRSYLTPVDHPDHRAADRRGAGRRHLRLVVRRWRRSASSRPSTAPSRSICASATAAPTVATVDVAAGADRHAARHGRRSAVRDIFIAGLGDSIASGEGNPDRPLALSDDGFCFRSYLGGRGGSITGRAAPATRAAAPAGAGHAGQLAALRARCGSMRPVTARSTATRPAPALALAVRVSAHRGDLSAAGLHRRHHCRRPARLAARAGMSADQDRAAAAEAASAARSPELRDALTAAKRRQPDRTARPRAAVDRRQRHLLLRPRRRRHRRHRRPSARCSTAAASMARRRRSRSALARDLPAGLCQAARGAEAAGRRRPLARGLHRPTPIRRSPVAARPAPAAAPASTSIRPSAPIRSGSPSVVDLSCRHEFLPQLKAHRAVQRRHPVPRSAQPTA